MAQSMEHPTFTMSQSLIEEIEECGSNKSEQVRQGMRTWIKVHKELTELGVNPLDRDTPTAVAIAVREQYGEELVDA